MGTRRLFAIDREVIAIWRENGIPLDRSTVEHAGQVVDALASELDQAWSIIRQLMDDRPVECSSCRSEIQPALFDGEVA